MSGTVEKDGHNLTITPFKETDWPLVWPLLQEAFADGESYPCPMDMEEAAARRYWIETPKWTYTARGPNGDVVGTYHIRPDQGGLGDHVCNCGYVVASAARGRGLAQVLCHHSQGEARRHGFRGMRFNLVVATNTPAIRAWEKSGMQIVGTVPAAFRVKDKELVDAHVMYKRLG